MRMLEASMTATVRGFSINFGVKRYSM